jgi:hypothetical protein
MTKMFNEYAKNVLTTVGVIALAATAISYFSPALFAGAGTMGGKVGALKAMTGWAVQNPLPIALTAVGALALSSQIPEEPKPAAA